MASTPDAALFCVQCSNATFRNLQVVHWARYGLAFNSVQNGSIVDNVIARDGISNSIPNQAINVSSSFSTSNKIVVSRNKIKNSGSVIDAANSEISFNRFDTNGYGAAIATAVDPPNSFDDSIIGNELSGGTGIDADSTAVLGIENGALRARIKGNIIHDNAGAGISNFGADSIISGNRIYDNGQLTSGPSKNSFGIINASDGTHVPSRTTITGNRIFDTRGAAGTQEYGYGENSAAIDGVTVAGNDLSGNKLGRALVLSPSTSLQATSSNFVVIDPNPCGTSGSCIAHVSWVSSTADNVQVWVSVDGQAGALFACGAGTFATDAPWIGIGHTYTFTAFTSPTCDASARGPEAARLDVMGIDAAPPRLPACTPAPLLRRRKRFHAPQVRPARSRRHAHHHAPTPLGRRGLRPRTRALQSHYLLNCQFRKTRSSHRLSHHQCNLSRPRSLLPRHRPRSLLSRRNSHASISARTARSVHAGTMFSHCRNISSASDC